MNHGTGVSVFANPTTPQLCSVGTTALSTSGILPGLRRALTIRLGAARRGEPLFGEAIRGL